MCHNECNARKESPMCSLPDHGSGNELSGIGNEELQSVLYGAAGIGTAVSDLQGKAGFSSPISGGLPGAAFGLRGEKTDFPAIAHSYGFWVVEYYGGSVFGQAVF